MLRWQWVVQNVDRRGSSAGGWGPGRNQVSRREREGGRERERHVPLAGLWLRRPYWGRISSSLCVYVKPLQRGRTEWQQRGLPSELPGISSTPRDRAHEPIHFQSDICNQRFGRQTKDQEIVQCLYPFTLATSMTNFCLVLGKQQYGHQIVYSQQHSSSDRWMAVCI